MTAMKLCLERIIPAYKSVSLALPLALPTGSLREQGKHTLQALSNGELSSEEATSVITALVGQARLIDLTDIEKRLEAVEQGRTSNGEDKHGLLQDIRQTPYPD